MMHSTWRRQRRRRKRAHIWIGQVVHIAWALFYISATRRSLHQWWRCPRYWRTCFIDWCRWKRFHISCARPAGRRRTLFYETARSGGFVAELVKIEQNQMLRCMDTFNIMTNSLYLTLFVCVLPISGFDQNWFKKMLQNRNQVGRRTDIPSTNADKQRRRAVQLRTVGFVKYFTGGNSCRVRDFEKVTYNHSRTILE